MSNLLHELENNEAILLMYIAGELPEEERREVEQMLSADSTLRGMHDELRMAWLSSMEGVDRLDAAAGKLASREAAARQVGRMVRQWHAARMIPKPVAIARPPRRLPWFRVSAAAAVFLFVGFLAWWGYQPWSATSAPTVAMGPDSTQTSENPPSSPDGEEPPVRFTTVDLTGMSDGELPALERSVSELDTLVKSMP